MNRDGIMDKTDTLAAEVLTLSRNTLLVHLRFLDAALRRLSPVSRPGMPATDGRTLYYDARSLLRAYQAERTAPARNYLHIVLHCVFLHFRIPEGAERDIWDLACDIAAESAIASLELPAVSAARERRQKKICAMLREAAVPPTAEKLYRYFLKQRPGPDEIARLKDAFLADDHRLWYEGGAGAEAAWRDVSRRMQVDMETFARQRGGAALLSGLREANREIPDYTGFLRKFAARGEPMQLAGDEFDYGLYSYGLQLYGGSVPLIEPAEYRETRRIRDFVLASGFSGAFPPETAQALLERTRAGLASAESALTGIRLHTLSGSADARAAFQTVESMRRQGKLQNLKGLLFLTDGCETFPAVMPRYPAAFVFVNDDYSIPGVPPWAIRMVLQKDEI